MSEFVRKIVVGENITNWLQELTDIDDKRLLWDIIKYKIREFTISFSKTKSKERRQKLLILENRVKQCQYIYSVNPNEANQTNLDELTKELDEHYDYITEGSIIRSRATWYEKGEKTTSSFWVWKSQIRENHV